MGGKTEVAVTVSLISKHIFGNANEDHLKKDFINSKATVLKIAQKMYNTMGKNNNNQ